MCPLCLRDFVRCAWHVLEPDRIDTAGWRETTFIEGWHLDAICEHLEAVTRGELRNLLINMPPRHMKSLAVAVFWPVWVWLTAPQRRWLFSSYALSLSIRDSLKCRRLIESPWFAERWSDRFALTGDQNAKMRFDNDHTGYRIATSVGGAATGEGGDVIVVDDPHNVQEKESDAVRESTLVWWDEVMSTRVNDPRTGAKVIVMQRVHEKDLSGHVLAQGGYEHLCLPAEFEPGRRCVTCIGWSDPRSAGGELLWPQRVGRKEIAEYKVRLGPSGYAGQFQQRPSPAGGGRFRQKDFRYWTKEGQFYRLHLLDGGFKLVSVDACDRFAMMDPAGTDAQQNAKACYTVVQVWDVTPGHDMILVDQWRGQVEAPEAADAGVSMVRRHDCPWLGVEQDGIGLGTVQTIRRKGVTVRPVKARGSKEARSETAEIRLAAGMVYFPAAAPWRFDLEQELLLFPNGEYKDQVDAFAHAAIHVHKVRGAPMAAEDGEAAEAAMAVARGEAVRLRDKPVAQAEDAELRRLLAENWEDAMWEEV